MRMPNDLDALMAAGHATLLAWMDDAADYLTGLVLAVEYVLDPETAAVGSR